jgi:hypothetical protein
VLGAVENLPKISRNNQWACGYQKSGFNAVCGTALKQGIEKKTRKVDGQLFP